MVTWSPALMSVSQRQRTTKRVTEYGISYIHWSQQKPIQPPQTLTYGASNLGSGVPTRFSGSGSGTDFILYILAVETNDHAAYYFKQSYETPLTVLQS